MNKKIIVILVFVNFVTAKAQSYLGYTHDNYAGIQSVLFNPASIADSRFKTDINLLSLSALFNNDAYGAKLSDITKSNYDFNKQPVKTLTSNNNAIFNLDVMGPSFMFNVAPKHSIAVFTRARALTNIVNINGRVYDDLAQNNNTNFAPVSIGSPNISSNQWGELGLSYAAVLYQRGVHFIKGGITAKYLQGVANYHGQAKDVSLSYIADQANSQNSQITTTGTVTYGSSQDFATNNTITIDSQSKGYGFDLGLVYEWRPEFDASRADLKDLKYVNKYKVRVGVSFTDFGSITYANGVRNLYDLNNSIKEADIDNASNPSQFLQDKYTETIVNEDIKANLPTALHADIDWNIHNKFYLNLIGDFSAADKNKLNQSSIANRLSLTPRFESRWFSFYVPVSYLDYNRQAQIGVGLRTGIFFIGSGSAITNLVSNNSRGADVHFGLKIPVYQKKSKDEPAVVEEKKEVAKEVEKDTDRDSVLDKEDACVDIAGPVENKGCPYIDTDEDGTLDKDDKCPTEIGPKTNSGCPFPDRDQDGVIDERDDCPDLAGTFENRGCPVVTKEVLEKLNAYSKSILFNSGKATIRPESVSKLQEIVKVMNQYSNANFKLEGFTDNTGSLSKNLQLSKERAAAAREYLIENGISADRLTSDGYGVLKPVASNANEKGRALNRRVEILLVP